DTAARSRPRCAPTSDTSSSRLRAPTRPSPETPSRTSSKERNMTSSTSSAKRFSGVYTALVTPFADDGSLDLESYRALIEDQIKDGVDGLVPCGTTGEAATLTVEEHLSVVKTCVEQVKGRVPVLAGAGNNSTDRAVEMHRMVKELKVDGALHVTPWYNKPT